MGEPYVPIGPQKVDQRSKGFHKKQCKSCARFTPKRWHGECGNPKKQACSEYVKRKR